MNGNKYNKIKKAQYDKEHYEQKKKEDPNFVKKQYARYVKNNPDWYKKRREKEKNNPEIIQKRNLWSKLYKRKRRIEIIKYYGGKCVCCGENKIEFLGIDHINGGGNKQRKETKMANIVDIVIKLKFPSTFRVLCHNCNLAIGFYGYCPHVKK